MRLPFARRILAVTFASVMLLQPPQAIADDVEVLLDNLEQTSHEATAKNEEIKELEVEIEEKLKRIDELSAVAATAQERADRVAQLRERQQELINLLSEAGYRDAAEDPVTAWAAENPQEMIDRTSYLGTLSRQRVEELARVEEELEKARRERNEANVAKAVVGFERAFLNNERKHLEEESAQLQKQIKELEERIDSLPSNVRQMWEQSNGPIAPIDPEAASGVVAAALSKLGSPYGWGATGPSAFDCSGLMLWAYQQQGKSIPRTSQAQLAGGAPVSMGDLQPGDIIGYYAGVTHVGMYIGNGQVVHASDYGIPVQVVPYDSMPIQGAARY